MTIISMTSNFRREIIERISKSEIKNIGVTRARESQAAYHNFADSTWFGIIEKTWITYLLENELLTSTQKDEVENKISEWKAELFPSNWWMYIVIAAFAILILVVIVLRRKPKREDSALPKL